MMITTLKRRANERRAERIANTLVKVTIGICVCIIWAIAAYIKSKGY